MATASSSPTLTSVERAVIKALLNDGWRGQDVQALINNGRGTSINSGRISAIKVDNSIVPADSRSNSDFCSLRQEQCVLHVDTKISDRVLNLGVTEQDLDGADVARRLVDHGRLRASERVSAIFLLAEADRGHPLVDQASILPCAHVVRVIDPAWKSIILNGAAAPFQPGQQARSYVAGDLELDRPPRLLLHDDRASPDLRTGDHITDPDFDQVAAAKLAVDGQIEQRTVTNASFAIEEEANCPDLLLGERTLGADLLSGILRCTLAAGIIKLRMAHVSSPRP